MGDRCSFTDVRLFILDISVNETRVTTGVITTGIITTGELATSEEEKPVSTLLGVVIGVAAFATVGVVFVLLVAYLWVSRKKKQMHNKSNENQAKNEIQQVSSEFSLYHVTIQEKIGSGKKFSYKILISRSLWRGIQRGMAKSRNSR